jgi:hypothetical protein
MTHDEALAVISSLESDDAIDLACGRAEDARRLLSLLPARAVAKIGRNGTIRIHPSKPGEIDFYWYRGPFLFSPGNRITNITTVGEATFIVRSSVAKEQWQRDSEGNPIIGRLNLTLGGAPELIGAICDQQFGVE